MASKEDLRAQLLELEPGNSVANSSATYNELRVELAAAKRRDKSKKKAQSVPVVVSYRHENEEMMSWKFLPKGGGDAIGTLQYGNEMPLPNAVADVDGVSVVVSSHEEGLDIMAIDLNVRNRFDARRIYTTPNGTHVVFKRLENGRVVLWSYKIQAEIMLGSQVQLKRTNKQARPIASRAKKMTQKILASYLIAQDPSITPGELTNALTAAFPTMSVGNRHGPHYLSLSRNGKLPEPPEDDPRDW